MLSNPLVSLIITFYKEKPHQVKRALESIINQTYKNIEIIIVIDNPESLYIVEIINEYLKNNPNVKIILNAKNSGISYSRNVGIKSAKGEYLAFMDGDDENMPERIEKQVNFMFNYPELDICGTGMIFCNESNLNQKFEHRPSLLNSQKNEKQFVFAYQGSLFCKRSTFDKYGYYDENEFHGEDVELQYRWFVGGVKTNNIDEPLILYYRSSEGANSLDSKHHYRRFILKWQYRKLIKTTFKEMAFILIKDVIIMSMIPRKYLIKIIFWRNTRK